MVSNSVTMCTLAVYLESLNIFIIFKRFFSKSIILRYFVASFVNALNLHYSSEQWEFERSCFSGGCLLIKHSELFLVQKIGNFICFIVLFTQDPRDRGESREHEAFYFCRTFVSHFVEARGQSDDDLISSGLIILVRNGTHFCFIATFWEDANRSD